jgi:hypothetical protein
MMTLYQMLSQAVESVDPQLMRAKIEDFEKTFEQSYGRKMTHEELSMLKTAKEIVERELWAEKLGTKAAQSFATGMEGFAGLTDALDFRMHTSAIASPPMAAPFNPGSGIT